MVRWHRFCATPTSLWLHQSALRTSGSPFKPDLIIQDEAAKSKEVSSLILLTAHSPLVYILISDAKQNSLYIINLFISTL